MARINVDTKFFSDGRIKLLKAKLKDELLFTTQGRLLTLWEYCYDHLTEYIHSDEINAITCHENFAQLLVESRLAEQSEDGKVRVNGVSERIQFYREAVEKGRSGGLKSVKVREEKYGIKMPIKGTSTKGFTKGTRRVGQGSTKGLTKGLTNEHEPSFSVSGSVSGSFSEKEISLRSPTSVEVIPDEYFDIGKRWLEFAQKQCPWKIKEKKWNPVDFGRCLQRITKHTGATAEGLGEILKFVEGDEFWRKNAISPFGLLQRSKNGNRKLDNLILSMQTRKTRQDEAFAKFAASDDDEYELPWKENL